MTPRLRQAGLVDERAPEAGRPGRRPSRPRPGRPGWPWAGGPGRRADDPARASPPPNRHAPHPRRGARDVGPRTRGGRPGSRTAWIAAVPAAGRHDQQPVDLPLQQDADEPYLFVFVLVTVGQDHGDRALAGSGLDAMGERGEERVGHVGQQQRDGVRALGAQAAGEHVGHVAGLGQRLLHTGSRLGGDQRRAVHHPGHGHGRDSGSLGDIVKRRHRSSDKWALLR